MKRYLCILMICAFFVAGCVRSVSTEPVKTASDGVHTTVEVTRPVEPVAPADLAAIQNVTWLWQAFAQTDPAGQMVVPNPADYSLLLNPDGSYTARVDCNQVLGSYITEGANITLLPGPATLVACGPDSLFDTFMAIMGQVQTFQVIDGQLYLIGPSGQMAFINAGMTETVPNETPAAPVDLTTAPQTTLSLVDVLWQWSGLTESVSGIATFVPNPEKYSLVFLKNGALRVQADCNTAAGTYTQDGANMKIQLGAMSLAACPGGSFSNAFIDLLGKVGTYQLNPDNLLLASADGANSMSFQSTGPVIHAALPPSGTPALTAFRPVVVRSGPGDDQAVLGVLLGGATAGVLGKSPDGAWLALEAPAGLGWVKAAEVSLFNTTLDKMNALEP